MFVQRFLGLPLGKRCNLLEGNVWRKVVSTFKKSISVRDRRFFVVVLSEMGVCNIGTRVAQGFVRTIEKYVVKSSD